MGWNTLFGLFNFGGADLKKRFWEDIPTMCSSMKEPEVVEAFCRMHIVLQKFMEQGKSDPVTITVHKRMRADQKGKEEKARSQRDNIAELTAKLIGYWMDTSEVIFASQSADREAVNLHRLLLQAGKDFSIRNRASYLTAYKYFIGE